MLLRSKNPEHDRFIAYYQDNKFKLFNYLMYRLNFDRALAEDLLMDIILKAFQHFQKFDPEKGSFKTWLFTLAHNHLINFWRSQKNKPNVSLEALEEEGFSPAYIENTDEEASKKIKSQNLQRVLLRMKESDREIINLRYLQELNYKEIAQITGRSEGAIRKHLSRARQHLAELYQKFYPKINDEE